MTAIVHRIVGIARSNAPVRALYASNTPVQTGRIVYTCTERIVYTL